jgi:hypothetical protein
MASRAYIVSFIVVYLILCGPLDYEWPAWVAIRIGYLIIIPLLTAILLRWVWKIWNPEEITEERLKRTLAGFNAGIFLVFTYESAVDPKGADIRGIIIFINIAMLSMWYGVTSYENPIRDSLIEDLKDIAEREKAIIEDQKIIIEHFAKIYASQPWRLPLTGQLDSFVIILVDEQGERYRDLAARILERAWELSNEEYQKTGMLYS